MKRMSEAEIELELSRIRKMPWTATFHKTLDNPTVPGGKIDMFILIDDDSGEGLATLAVPHGQHWLAEYVAGCCADPYFVRNKELGMDETSVAVALNRALTPFFHKQTQTIDGREVFVAALTILQAYLPDLGKRARDELIDKAMKTFADIRRMPE